MSERGEFDAWYRAEYERLVAALALALGDLDLARDAAAEACARSLKRWTSSGPPDHPTAWAYRVALNYSHRQWRRRHREATLLDTARRTAAVPDAEPAIELWAAVAGLAPRARTAVALRYLGDLTEAEVARAMGIAPGTVAATLSKARAQLADVLGADPKEGSHA